MPINVSQNIIFIEYGTDINIYNFIFLKTIKLSYRFF